MQRIILFYKYIHIANPESIMAWQKKICRELQLKGRVILAHEGINGTLGGNPAAIAQYVQQMQADELFADIDFKESFDEADRFPRLRIVVKKEIVHLGLDPNIISAAQAGVPLAPVQAHALIAQKPNNLVIIDCRNQVESAIGIIDGAIRPPVDRFRDFPAYVDEHASAFKDKQILMYCTGGVRCERASAYIKSKNVAQEVYHIKGGIHRYVQEFPHGFFKGKNYVFDGRTAVRITDDVLGNCFICDAACDDYTNCLRAQCNRHFICCNACKQMYGNTCGATCKDQIINQNAACRPSPVKTYN
jgi:predicted sulfurtransferase